MYPKKWTTVQMRARAAGDCSLQNNDGLKS